MIMSDKYIIQVVEDNRKHLESLTDLLEQKGYSVLPVETAEKALEQLESGQNCHLAIIDIRLPGMNGLELAKIYRAKFPQTAIIIRTGYADVPSAVGSMKIGAVDYLEKTDKPDNLLLVIRKEFEKQSFAQENLKLTDALNRKSSEAVERYRLVGNSPVMSEVHRQIKEFAAHDASILITGESGVGKENAAQLIHHFSARRHKPLIKVNIAALPKELIESALFGHIVGAFTGAVANRTGSFELAHGATIFLDEIGDIPLELQVKLLNVIQDKQFQKVGSNKNIVSDFRLITATNHHLTSDEAAGKFRKDLYYRIKVFELKMPPLRNHPEDMESLTAHLIKKFSEKHNKYIEGVTPQAIELLKTMPWPGNVRQLENLLECCALRVKNNLIDKEDLMAMSSPAMETDSIDLGGSPKLHDVIRALIKYCLAKSKENKTLAADMMGIKRTSFYSMMDKYKVS